jgi:hypothetical protein
MKNAALPEALIAWMKAEHLRLNSGTRVPREVQEDIAKRAARILSAARINKSLRVLELRERPIALMALAPSRMPRIKNQKSVVFFFDRRQSKKALTWLRSQLRQVAPELPLYTQIGISTEQDKSLRRAIEGAGFNTRYEILEGDTQSAYRALMRHKEPPDNLVHLQLELREIKTPSQLRAAMALQKTVALLSKRHGYFSHTPAQLRADHKEYAAHLRLRTGKLLGVYRGKRILGLMMASIHGQRPRRSGGFSFFLHPKVQGKGIVKTGYRVLLEYLLQEKIRVFHGGTSQPAVQSLGKIMKRRVCFVIYVKMD